MGSDESGAGRAGTPEGVPGDATTSPAAVEWLRLRITRAVRRACPSWLQEQVEDIVQNVLVQLLAAEKKRETNPGYSSTYLAKAAYGATVDELRRLARRKERPVSDPVVLETAPTPSANPETRAEQEEVGAGIRDCLIRLLQPRRMAVTLYLQGCSVPEIAQRRSWNFKRAHNLVYRGLADLRGCLERKGLAP